MLDAILRAIEFYKRSAIWAAKGTLERANAWFWPFGVPIVGGINYWAWGGKMNIPEHIPEFLIFMTQTVLVSWVILFIVRFVGAGPHFAYVDAQTIAEQKKTIAAYESQHRPAIRLFLDQETQGITESPTELNFRSLSGPPSKGPDSKWVQVSIACGSEASLVNCEAWLTSVRRIETEELGSQLAEEQVNCEWSQLEATSITIRPGRTQRANIFALHDTRPVTLANRTRPPKVRLRDAIQNPGSYKIKILVTADDAPSVEREYVFTWKSFKDVTLVPA